MTGGVDNANRKVQPMRTVNGIDVLFRKSPSIADPEARHPGCKPGRTVLPKGSVHRKGALPLPCEILWERDVSVALRDGTTIYVDLFKPVGGNRTPAIVAWSPYGKKGGYQNLDIFPGRAGIPVSVLSDLQAWEGPDPAYWCSHGYTVVNADARGAFMSQGDIRFWGTQEGEDGHDLVEWLSDQEWCNGKVGLTGNSWLAVVQWFIASTRPSHLAAIAPWEGFCDFYRHSIARGGIPDTWFNEWIMAHLYGANEMEDPPAMIRRYPLMNPYWEDKAAALARIEVPAYVVASYTSVAHASGTIEGFRGISSRDKWLRIHNSMEWPDSYESRNVEDLRKFFDRYLKGTANGWEETPRVRLSVLDPGGVDMTGRPEVDFPPKDVVYRKLYLDGAARTLREDLPAEEALRQYQADDGKSRIAFDTEIDRDTDLIGDVKLLLWLETIGADDADVFVTVEKFNKRGRVLFSTTLKLNPMIALIMKLLKTLGRLKSPLMFYSGPNGRFRASLRQLDGARSTESQPYHTFAKEELLKPGEIVPVEIPLLPVGMKIHRGQKLRVSIGGYDPAGPLLPGMPPIPTRNKGVHIIHTGGRFNSHLLIPVAPDK
jgi:uncharacterized protein